MSAKTPERSPPLSHRGFSDKARGVLLETAVIEKPTHKKTDGQGSVAAPHRGFNEKAREVLLERRRSPQHKSDPVASARIKGCEKLKQIA
ncbi:hypothetical protein AB6A40_004343 [Gnathostoma spinigerum]|uniref:Uncharacterized protein n=1 Tax=Gnathostoma spinigerum TaxID=75299 RepID=A0ABD6EHL0_9BILA